MYINGTYVHKELFISCNFKVGMIIKWAKFQKFKSEFVYLMILNFEDITDMKNKQKIF